MIEIEKEFLSCSKQYHYARKFLRMVRRGNLNLSSEEGFKNWLSVLADKLTILKLKMDLSKLGVLS